MNSDSWLLVLIVFSSFVTGVIIFFLKEEARVLRTLLNLLGAAMKLALVGLLILCVYHERVFETRWTMLPGLDFVLRADALSVLFVTLSAGLWFLTTLYAVGYLEDSHNRSRFFGVFSLCVSATAGIALSGNLITFLFFYEALTLSTYPLVVHRGTEKALRAETIYLAYTLGGGLVLLLAVAWLQSVVGPVDFHAGDVLAAHAGSHRGELIAIFALLMVGLGVKAALVPLHGWLLKVMIAPAPVSALLHAVAVVKAGAFRIVRVVYGESGLLGVSEISSDMRDLLAREATDVRAAEAVALFCYQAKKWIGSFAAALGGLDTLVFAGGIGEKAPLIRTRICEGLGFLGLELNEARNAETTAVISEDGSRLTIRVIPTDEELMIARSVSRVLNL